MSDKSKNYPATEDGLWEAFFETDEMLEYVEASDKINAALERGDAEVALPTAFLAKTISGKVNFQDPEIVAAWNRCCDLVGLPDKKVAEPPGPSGDDMRARHEVTASPKIRYKTPPKENEQGDKEDLPF